MKAEIISVFFSEGGRFISEILRARLPRGPESPSSVPKEPAQNITKAPGPVTATPTQAISEEQRENNIKKGVACLPCTNSHLLTCRGLLDEAHRMSHNGLTPEGMERVDQCLGEIAAAERVDLAPSNIATLVPEEQEIARYAANEIRNIRHDLEGVTDPRILETAAAKTAELQKYVSREYFKLRLSKLSPEAKNLLKQRLEQQTQEKKYPEGVINGREPEEKEATTR